MSPLFQINLYSSSCSPEVASSLVPVSIHKMRFLPPLCSIQVPLILYYMTGSSLHCALLQFIVFGQWYLDISSTGAYFI
jgi:hypothetical protein